MALFGTIWHCFGGCLSQKAKPANGLRQTKNRVGTLAIWNPKRVADDYRFRARNRSVKFDLYLLYLLSLLSPYLGNRDKKDKRYNDSTLHELLKLIARSRNRRCISFLLRTGTCRDQALAGDPNRLANNGLG